MNQINNIMIKTKNYRNHIELFGDDNEKADILWKSIFDDINRINFDGIKITDNEMNIIENIIGDMNIKKDEVSIQLNDYLAEIIPWIFE